MIILVGVIGARDIARVVKAEPCGLLHKRDRGDLSGEEGVGTWGEAGRPRPHLAPHSLPAKWGDICLLCSLQGLELPAARAAGFWAHTDLWGTEPPGGSQDRGRRTCSSNLPLSMGREGGL